KKDESDENDFSKDYLSEWTLRGIIKQYSDFVVYPIMLRDECKKDDDKKDEKEEPVNSMKALWTRPESEVTDDEYKEFYHHITHDWDDPLERITYKAEGTSEFRALLYIPSRQPMDLFFQDGKHGIQLYIRRVFIMNDCKDMIPEYLRFVKGVVDSEDLSLNVSREILQQDRQASLIKNSLTRKILDTLKKMKQERVEDYKKFWQTFGLVLKEGIISDIKNREQIMDLCDFDSSNGEKTTLQDYVAHMADGQKKIYYLSGGSAKNLASSPKLEAFRKSGVDVLLLSDAVDEVWVNNTRKYKDYDFVSIATDDIELPDSMKDGKAAEDEKLEESGFIKKIKDSLAGLVEDVKISQRLVDSPACFVQKGEPISAQMRNFFKSIGQEVPEEKKILEINPEHPLVKKIAEEAEKDGADISEWSSILMGLASISDGEPVADGKKFTELLSKMLEK
ncbi:MAG: molecular chaperone HtpG, partial [Synergistaceae bacterium]|nr:molecular chaperone HtpG [Synergistaceae bacterium]